ncbi:hypothetical protein HU200_041693 [Digitaria exilis]|uniref:Uncharacterized protein n=1 Tax=Digitaria exilis TaxID=1010633 RepID=A0A835B8D1_9POAL|nr:hypothetical protein HU200_041693 [Digitaria exilis]
MSGGYHCCLHHRFPMRYFFLHRTAIGLMCSNMVFVLQGKIQINGFYSSATSPHHVTWPEHEWLLLHAWVYGGKDLVLLGSSKPCEE